MYRDQELTRMSGSEWKCGEEPERYQSHRGNSERQYHKDRKVFPREASGRDRRASGVRKEKLQPLEGPFH